MRKLSIYFTIFLCLLSAQAAPAGLVTDTFSGSVSLVTPGNLGDHSGATYTFNVSTTNSVATLSYDISLSVGTGPVHFDARGFGDSGGSNDAFQGSRETMSITLSNLSVTASSGYTYVSDNVTSGFTQFDLVNNGPNSPQIIWSDDQLGGGLYASSGTSSGHIETVAVTSGAQQININAFRRWMWINNAVTTYAGSVTVDDGLITNTVPEPSSCLTFLAALGFGMCRRRKRQVPS